MNVAENGLLVLPGAAAAQNGGTSGMIGYGMNKAAVHHMVKSLAQEKSGLANGVGVFATLPTTLDTPMNRKWMAKADQSKENFIKMNRKFEMVNLIF